MGDGKGKQVPFKEGMMVLPRSPGDRGNLLGSRCKSCGEQFFIRRDLCESCQGRELEDILLGNRGKLYAFSVMYYPAPPPYKPPDPFVPYGLGWIEMPGGTVLYSLLTENDPKKLNVGMDMELVFDKFGEDKEGNDIMICKFKPTAH